MSSTNRADEGSVSLTVPARPEYLRLVRLAAADTGARAELSIEEIDDLRIAVDELSYALIGDDPLDETLTLRYVASPGVVEIEGACVAPDEPFEVTQLSKSIIGAVVDEHEISQRDGTRRFRLVKRHRT
jgi:serine/threonine-protein kinase RsbW